MSTTQSSDVTAKRASTEGDSASSTAKKARVEEEDYTKMEDESDGEFDAEAEGHVTGGRLKDFSEPEPEWDVDSYDGREYETDPDCRALFDNEDDYLEFRNERIQALKDKGFVADPARWIGPIGDLEQPSGRNMTNGEYLADIACLCVKKLNEEKGKTVEFVSVVRANMGGAGNWKLYITFMAREYQNGPLVEYQAKAMDFAGRARPPFPILCRPAPNPS